MERKVRPFYEHWCNGETLVYRPALGNFGARAVTFIRGDPFLHDRSHRPELRLEYGTIWNLVLLLCVIILRKRFC